MIKIIDAGNTYVSFPILFLSGNPSSPGRSLPLFKRAPEWPRYRRGGGEWHNGSFFSRSYPMDDEKEEESSSPSIFLLARVAKRALHENIFVRFFKKNIYPGNNFIFVRSQDRMVYYSPNLSFSFGSFWKQPCSLVPWLKRGEGQFCLRLPPFVPKETCHIDCGRKQEQTLFKDLRRQDIERNKDEAKKE